MKIHVKICGITDLDSAVAAVEAGADAVGFVFADSVRQVSPGLAAQISSELPGRVERFAVFLRPKESEVAGVLDRFGADVVQADHGTVRSLEGPRWLPVFREGESDLLGLYLDGTVNRRFMYEGIRSGIGQTVDWSVAFEFARRGRMTLAGGLTPDNVSRAIREVRPFGVDVSSGVESRPGVKDPDRIREFIETVRETEKELVKS